MKRLILVLVSFAFGLIGHAQKQDSLLVMFWNVENFFDWTDQGTGDSDKEFSSYGDRRWTRNRFYAKCDALAKTFMWTADRHGRMPDVIGLAEVENRGVLTKFLSSTLMRKFDYGIVHCDSKDRRGIDVALLYRKSSMALSSRTFVALSDMSTRDILHAQMILQDGQKIDFIVNHHPSKYGGAEESEERRMTVMGTLKSLCDSLVSAGSKGIVAMGDFNDIPTAPQFRIIDSLLINKGLPLHEKGEGTIRYEGKWDLIDNFLASPSLHTSDMEVLRIPFLMTYEKKYPGEQPLRTYSGPRYLGGVSDHCPIMLWIY